MPRPQKITDEQILAAARRCFLANGPHASCERIAEELGVSTAALFKRFGTKEKLQRAALSPQAPSWVDELPMGPRPGEPVFEQLLGIAERFLGFFQEMVPRMLCLKAAGAALEVPVAEGPGGEGAPLPVHVQRTMARWIAKAQAEGRLAEADPLAVAQAFVGGLQARAMLEHLGGIPEREEAAFLEQLVGVLWRGIAPVGAPAASPPDGEAPLRTRASKRGGAEPR